MSRLEINAGETYTVNAGETEEWSGTDIDGTLQINGTLKLIDNPQTPETPETKDPQQPTFHNLLTPTNITLQFTAILSALFLPFIYISTKLRSGLIIFILCIDLIIILMHILLGLSFIWFWIAMIITAITSIIASISAYI